MDVFLLRSTRLALCYLSGLLVSAECGQGLLATLFAHWYAKDRESYGTAYCGTGLYICITWGCQVAITIHPWITEAYVCRTKPMCTVLYCTRTYSRIYAYAYAYSTVNSMCTVPYSYEYSLDYKQS